MRVVHRCDGYGSRSPDDGNCHTRQLKDLDMPETTFTCPELTAFLGLDAQGFRGLIHAGRLKDHLTTAT